ncbi:MAG TPA: PDZ domain-containing protein [Pyrinomonadaceae bacterium]|nr:PDZ domain-containing protein [Pyrinomonadaceae bacterium]
MQPERPETKSSSSEFESTQCPQCQAVLPRGLRFCRACGYRLGEGLEEYVETVRLKPRVSGEAKSAPTNEAAQAQNTSPFQPQPWAPMAPHAPAMAIQKGAKFSCAKPRKGHWFLWMIIAIVIMSVAGGGLLTPFALRANRARRAAATVAAKQSFFGISGFRSDGGGASFDYVTPPGGPADKAGLVGGDVITSYDGQPVKNADDMRRLLEATPVGKTVDVVYLRDGQTRTGQLTTITKEEGERLGDAFDEREKGYLKEGTDIDRVIVPGMNIYGVRLNKISRSGPADLAGLKDGDIVIEFGGIPTRTRRELEFRIERAEPYSTVTVVVIRDGQRMEIPVKVGLEP